MRHSDDIQRLHFVDLEIWPNGDVTTASYTEAAVELATGLLVQHSILIPLNEVDGMITEYPVVRFTGSRNQLDELLNRYHGVFEAFAPSDANPDTWNFRPDDKR